MKRNSILIALCLLSFLGYSQNSIEGIVAVVGNKVILKSLSKDSKFLLKNAFVGEDIVFQEGENDPEYKIVTDRRIQ